MAFTNTFDTATPAGSDDPAEADDRMREIKAAVQERENVDHYWPLTGTEVSDADAGEHRKVTLRVGSAPTAVADKGFVYAKDVGSKAELFYRDEDGNEVQLTSKGQNLANDTYLTGTDAAGTGSVNLIKAGTNDLATLPDSAEMASSAAPVEDEAIVNKKYVVDTIGVIQTVNTQHSGVTTYTNQLIPVNDDTIPQNDEGEEYTELATAITPVSATNKLLIEVHINWGETIDTLFVAALFQDSDADALAVISDFPHSAFARAKPATLRFLMTAGTTSETTFKIRVGTDVNSVITINGWAGARKFGGVMFSSMTITERKP